MWGGELITYERDVLYKQVWSEPVRTVAQTYGVSDVYLAKICRQLDVPLPGRGYWAKVRAGKSPRRTRLPKPKKGAPERLASWHRRSSQRERKFVHPEAKLTLPEPIVVPETLEDPHRLVARTERRLGKAKPQNGVVRGRPFGLLDVSVSPDALNRALRILDALLKGMQALGLHIEITPEADQSQDRWHLEHADPPDRATRVHCNEE
jgi:hypothetical protein